MTHKRTYRGYASPLECFRDKYKRKKIMRKQLAGEDQGLYRALLRREEMDEAIPEKAGVTYRGYASPLECFRDKYKRRKVMRGQLAIEDSGLHRALLRRGEMDEAI